MRAITLDLRYSLLALAYTAMIFWFGSRPHFGIGRSDPATQLVANLFHIPLYAGLGFWVLQAVSGGESLGARPLPRAFLTLVIAGGVALLDEWRQGFMPMRDASVADLALDVLGVAGLLGVCAVTREVPPS